MSQDEIRSMASTLRTRVKNDPQFRASVLKDPHGTLTAEGYADALVGDVEREVAMGRGDDVSGFAGCRAVTCVLSYVVW